MTKHEAKLLLHAYRTSGRDAQDPRLAEALDWAEKDPELKAWFAEWQSYDRVVAQKLKAAPTVSGQLLTEIRTGAAERAAAPARRRRFALALAAGLVALGVAAALWQPWIRHLPPAGAYAELRSDMADFLQEFPRLDLESDRLAEVQDWLAGHTPFAVGSVPEGLRPFPPIGCRTIDWRGRQVALVCFMVDGEVFHLVVLPSGHLPGDKPVGGEPEFARAGRFNTVTWHSGSNVLLAMTPGSEAVLRRVL